MRTLTEENLTDAVIAQFENCPNDRLKLICVSLIKHLHAFVRDVELTPEEWFKGIEFLTKTGKMCDDVRQEFILLSDTIGVSMLVDAIANRKPAGATESSVLGPFYVEGAPEKDNGADLAIDDASGEKVKIAGLVKSVTGDIIPGAVLDVWQTAPNGLYHMQDRSQKEFHLCGKFFADAQGRYSFKTLKPVSYSIPDDGPVGYFLDAVKRHPNRPAHVHFIVSAPGYKSVITQLFAEGDPYLESDAVFGVKDSLVVNFGKEASGELSVDYDFVLEKI